MRNVSLSLLLGYLCLLTACIVGLALLWRRDRSVSLPRWLLLIPGLAIGPATLLLLLEKILIGPTQPWNPARLAPAFALARGLPIYQPPHEGPLLSVIYGPITPLSFLPATIFQTPVAAVLAGMTLAVGYFLVPVLIWLWRLSPPTWRGRLSCLSVFFLFCWFTYFNQPLQETVFWIHADGPALGLAASACLLLLQAVSRPQQRMWLILAALTASLSVWTKQISLPLLVALPVYLFLAQGRRQWLTFSLIIGITITALTGLLLVIFNPKRLLFNTFTVPGSHPAWPGPLLPQIQTSFLTLLNHSQLPLLIILLYSVYLISAQLIASRQAFFTEQPWTLPALVGVYMIPMGVLAKIKVGGSLNSLSFTLYFLGIAAAIILLKILTSDQIPPLLMGLTGALLSVLISGQLILHWPLLQHVYRTLPNHFDRQHLLNNPIEVVYRYSQQYPGQGYFTWHPLSTLLGEGRYYHYNEGILDRELAGYPLTPSHLQAGLPDNMQFIGYAWSDPAVIIKDEVHNKIKAYLPEYTVEGTDPNLPGFKLFFPQEPT